MEEEEGRGEEEKKKKEIKEDGRGTTADLRESGIAPSPPFPLLLVLDCRQSAAGHRRKKEEGRRKMRK